MENVWPMYEDRGQRENCMGSRSRWNNSSRAHQFAPDIYTSSLDRRSNPYARSLDDQLEMRRGSQELGALRGNQELSSARGTREVHGRQGNAMYAPPSASHDPYYKQSLYKSRDQYYDGFDSTAYGSESVPLHSENTRSSAGMRNYSDRPDSRYHGNYPDQWASHGSVGSPRRKVEPRPYDSFSPSAEDIHEAPVSSSGRRRRASVAVISTSPAHSARSINKDDVYRSDQSSQRANIESNHYQSARLPPQSTYGHKKITPNHERYDLQANSPPKYSPRRQHRRLSSVAALETVPPAPDSTYWSKKTRHQQNFSQRGSQSNFSSPTHSVSNRRNINPERDINIQWDEKRNTWVLRGEITNVDKIASEDVIVDLRTNDVHNASSEANDFIQSMPQDQYDCYPSNEHLVSESYQSIRRGSQSFREQSTHDTYPPPQITESSDGRNLYSSKHLPVVEDVEEQSAGRDLYTLQSGVRLRYDEHDSKYHAYIDQNRPKEHQSRRKQSIVDISNKRLTKKIEAIDSKATPACGALAGGQQALQPKQAISDSPIFSKFPSGRRNSSAVEIQPKIPPKDTPNKETAQPKKEVNPNIINPIKSVIVEKRENSICANILNRRDSVVRRSSLQCSTEINVVSCRPRNYSDDDSEPENQDTQESSPNEQTIKRCEAGSGNCHTDENSEESTSAPETHTSDSSHPVGTDRHTDNDNPLENTRNYFSEDARGNILDKDDLSEISSTHSVRLDARQDADGSEDDSKFSPSSPSSPIIPPIVVQMEMEPMTTNLSLNKLKGLTSNWLASAR